MIRNTRHVVITLAAGALVAAACAGGPATGDPVAQPATTTTTATTSTTAVAAVPGATDPTTTPAPTTTVAAVSVEDFFVALSNLLGEGDNRRQACEEQVNETQPVTADSSAEQVTAYLQAMFTACMVETFATTTSVIADLDVPESLAAAHEEYVNGRNEWYTVVRGVASGIETWENAEAAFENPDLVMAQDVLANSCSELEAAAAQSGYTVSLGCPIRDTPDDRGRIEATIGPTGITITPAGEFDLGAGIELVIVNESGALVRPMVVTLFSGEPDRLPLDGDIVDLTESGVAADATETDPDRAFFGLVFPEPAGEGQTVFIPELAPGDAMGIGVPSGAHVLFDHTAGAYRSGSYAPFVVSSMRELQDIYVAGPLAAETCDQLAAAIANLYREYITEVRILDAAGFLASPLAMIDDMRFGATLQQTGALGCDSEQLDAAVTASFCPVSVEGVRVEDETAPAVIAAHVCGDGP